MLLPVVVAITLLAAITFMLSYQGVSQGNIVSGEYERDRLRFVAEAGIAHAKVELARNTSCKSYASIPKTDFGGDSYTAQISPDNGSPVRIQSSVTLASGKSLDLYADAVPAYEPSATAVVQLSTSSGRDTFLEDSFPDRNYGTAGSFKIESAGVNWRPLLEFDVSKIPPGAKIHSATLELKQLAINAPGEVFVHRITQDWEEGTKNGGGAGDGASWNTFDGVTAWATPGGEFDGTVYGSTFVSSSEIRPTWDITPLVQEWVSGTVPNRGLMLKADSAVRNASYASRETNNPADAPKLTVSYACECGTGCTVTAPGGKTVLLVVLDPVNMTAQDTAKQTLIEGWGHTVNLIDDDAAQAEFDAAYAVNDVAYMSEQINSGTLSTKLRNATIGVVFEEQKIPDELGVSSAESVYFETAIDIVDNTHYITETFSTGTLTIVSSSQEVGDLGGTLAPGLQVLAQRPSSTRPTLAFIETGGALFDGGTADGRRVKVPWGGNTFDTNALTADGQTIMKRAIEWGAGEGGSSVGFYLDEFPDFSCDGVDEYAGSNGTLDWSGTPWAESGDDGRACGANLRVVDDPLIDDPTGNRLRLQNKGRIAERMADLSSFPAAFLSFDYRRDGLSGGAAFDVSVSGDGGTNWVTLDSIGAGTDTAYQSASYDLSAFTGPNTMIRFASNSSFSGDAYIDNVRIDANGTSSKAPVAHWKLDETSGTTAVDSVGGNDGQLNGSGMWTSGSVDGALAVDYTDGEDYILVPNSSGLENVQEGDYTLSAWFRPDSTPPGINGDNDANYGILVKRGWHTGIHFSNGNRFVFEQFLDGDIGVASTSGNTFTPGSFYHVAATVDRAAGLQSLYVNGQLEDTSGFTPGAAAREYGTELWRIGIASPGASSWGWAADGVIDDVRIYDEVLTAAAVSDLYSLGGGGSGSGGSSSSPVFESFAEAKLSSAGTSIAVPAPTGTSDGDLLISVIVTNGEQKPPMTTPAGWNLIDHNDRSKQVTMDVHWKLAGASEPGSYDFSWAKPQEAYAFIMRFSGHDPASPIHATQNDGSSSSTPLSPAVTTTVANAMILRIGGFDDDDITVGDPGLAGHTAITMDSSGTGTSTASGGAGYMIQASAGDSGTANFALGASEEYRTVTIAIAPAP